MKSATHFSLDELCSLVDLPKRTIRFYIQQGLVERPDGDSPRGAYYTDRHVEQLLAVRKWKDAGLSLERIAQILSGVSAEDIPPAPHRPGEVEVWSRIHLAEGVELHLHPGRAGLRPEQVRELSQELLALFSSITRKEQADAEGIPGS
jgi:DNA-binding transcriptional MerR regulator